ncbi:MULTISPECIES: hypothetical protein [Nocardioides]|jgi:hypothetical protein|uniref:Uncharacterized protein n=2 Tax=Nocardioides TaxID=1839 RepID=A0ABT8TPU9_9ACTN|nr:MULTISPECIES: hypothetical protein [Nocardioides]MBM7510145.1 hypothetical protein [Nocardioides salarius]MDO3395028.1 hypothetical protein [Nocardioides cremeus]
MSELLFFITLVLLVTGVALALLEVIDADDPFFHTDYRPPRSHPDEPFDHSGSWYH